MYIYVWNKPFSLITHGHSVYADRKSALGPENVTYRRLPRFLKKKILFSIVRYLLMKTTYYKPLDTENGRKTTMGKT